jgi:uncharacterized protein
MFFIILLTLQKMTMTKTTNFKLLFLLTLLFAAIIRGFAQSENGIINSGELIKKGVELHDAEKYDEALSYYNQVHENDTNFGLATAEKAFAYYAKKDYANAIKLCEEALKIGTDFDKNIYITLGSAYDDSGNQQKAIEVFDKGISEFPKNYLILFNKAVTLVKQEKFQEAAYTFQKTIELNPFHASSHLRLGQLAEQEGELTKAILCYNTFLVVEPASERSLAVLNMLDLLCSKKYDDSKAKGIKLSSTGDDFKEIEVLLRKQLALNSNYKLESKADFPVIRQNQALLSYLVNHKGKEGFWEKFYVPFYAKIYSNKLFETFSYFLLVSSSNEKIKSLVNKNNSNITKFVDWKATEYNNHVSKRKIEIDGKLTDVVQIYYKDGHLYGLGPVNATADKKNGKWEFYHVNGKMMAKGKFDATGQQTGPWVFYYSDGKLKKETSFVSDQESGAYKIYHRNGNVTESGNKSAGKLNGEIKVFTIYGGIAEVHNFKSDVHEGKYDEFHSNGKLSFTGAYKEGKLNGPIKTFYPTEKVSLEGVLKDGNKEGIFTTYFNNGQINIKKNYLLNKENGSFTRYFQNGKLSEEGTFKNEKLSGQYKSYFVNGILEESSVYNESGQLNGKQQYFDIDGKLYYEADYKDGKLTQYKYFDKKGTVVYETKLKSKQEAKTFFSDGTLKWIGNVEDSRRSGLWKEYFRNGILKAEYNYKNGLLEGMGKEYYMNGKVKKEIQYKDDKAHGKYREYYRNGQLYKSAWYDNGDGYGDVYLYRYNGVLETKYFVYNNNLKGKMYNYDVNGKLQSVEQYENDMFVKYTLYDTSGNVIQELDINKENLPVQYLSVAGKVVLTRNYTNGFKNGESKGLYMNGSTESLGNYINNERHGVWKWYHPNNKLATLRNYELGKLEGLYENYDLFGDLRARSEYYNDEKHGKSTLFYYNGNVRQDVNYFQGEEHGITKLYSFDGTHILSMVYVYDVLKGIVYPSKSDTVPAKVNDVVEAKYPNGKTAIKMEFKNAEMHGKYYEYFDDGTPCRELDFDEGKLNGIRKTWYRNGKVRSIENYKYDSLEGITTLYYESGNKQAEISFKNGLYHGPVKYYDAGGKLKAHYEFYNDQMIKIVL